MKRDSESSRANKHRETKHVIINTSSFTIIIIIVSSSSSMITIIPDGNTGRVQTAACERRRRIRINLDIWCV